MEKLEESEYTSIKKRLEAITQTDQHGYFKTSVIRQLLQEHQQGTQDHHRVLWQLLVLELWHREYIDQ